jgi:hypothetical protein
MASHEFMANICVSKKLGDFNTSIFISRVLQSILGKSTMVNEYLTQHVKTTTCKRVKKTSILAMANGIHKQKARTKSRKL